MKYTTDTINKIIEALSNGKTQKDAAKIAGVSDSQFHEWLHTKPEFVEAVKKAKAAYADWLNSGILEDARKSLKDLICGQEVEERQTEYGTDAKGNIVVRKSVVKTKKILPSATAVIFALCNRDPEHWQNRVSNEITGKITSDTKSDVSLKNVPDELLAQVIKAINEK